MTARSLRLPALLVASSLAVAGCAYGDGYGYGGISAGYGGYCDPYWDDCYGGGGGGYYDPWYGWYDDYYYPGWGVFVYDQWRRPHRWNDHHRSFWEQRRSRWGNRNWNDRRWQRWDGWDRRGGGEWRRDDRRRGDRDWSRWRQDGGSSGRSGARARPESRPRSGAEEVRRERSRDWSGRRRQHDE